LAFDARTAVFSEPKLTAVVVHFGVGQFEENADSA
jgi:hypothetical protein